MFNKTIPIALTLAATLFGAHAVANSLTTGPRCESECAREATEVCTASQIRAGTCVDDPLYQEALDRCIDLCGGVPYIECGFVDVPGSDISYYECSCDTTESCDDLASANPVGCGSCAGEPSCVCEPGDNEPGYPD